MKTRLDSWISTAFSAALMLLPSAGRADETVQSMDSMPNPPRAAEAPAEGAFTLEARYSCAAQNNRNTSNAANTLSSTTLFLDYKIKFNDNSTEWYRVAGPGTLLLTSKSSAFSCLRQVAANAQTGFNGNTCSAGGASFCAHGTGNVQYVCDSRHHPQGGTLHDFVIGSTVTSMMTHAASGGNPQISHVDCELGKPSRAIGNRRTRAEVVCRHQALQDLSTSVSVLKSADGVNWSLAGAANTVAERGRLIAQIPTLGTRKATQILEYKLTQDVAANASNCGFGGCDGPVSFRPIQTLATAKRVSVAVAPFAMDLSCGAYHSPLMAFFKGEKMPEFTGVSSFSMGNKDETYSWPEKGSQGSFVAIDSHGDRSIRDESQLFGNNDSSSNGFEALAVHDQNKDGVIDASDAVFEKLLLWNDRNSDSVAQKGEVRSMKEAGVVSFSLAFNPNSSIELEGRALIKQSSTFSYKTSKGKLEVGRVFDIWFKGSK